MSASLLAAWERGQGRDPTAKAVALLSATTGRDEAAVAALPLGARDALLFDLRRRVFGDRLTAVVSCPRCADRVEVPVSLSAVCAGLPTESAPVDVVEQDGMRLTVRVPDSGDARAAARLGDIGAARRELVRRCLSAVDRTGASVDVDALPAGVVALAAERLAELAPHADVRLRLTCPGCAGDWLVPLDIGLVLWAEVAVWARRTLLEVHELASAYGWTEPEILGLGPYRRQAYLDLVSS